MRTTLLAIALGTCAATASPSFAQTTYAFAGLPWGSTRAEVKADLVGKGYAFDKLDEDGDLAFTGSISNVPTRIFAFFDPDGQLVKVSVILVTPDEDARPKFASTVEQLKTKYGTPDLTRKDFDSPYEAGDGYEDQAIHAGKGHFGACWTHGEKVLAGVAQDALCAVITKSLTVSIDYESVRWDREADRRRAKASKDL